MESIAENTTTVTKKLFFEGMAAATSYRSYVLKRMGLLALGWVVLAVFLISGGAGIGLPLMELGVLAALSIWLVFFMPRGKYRRSFHAMEQRYGGDLTRKVIFYETECRMEAGSITLTIPYADIAAVRLTRHLLVLTGPDKAGILADRDGFTKGSAELVLERIRSVQKGTV